MINKSILVGRLTKDPELRKTPNGTSVSTFTLAVDRRVRKGEQSQADFITCVAWNATADLLCQYMHKGSLIGVEGRIQTRNYEDQNNPGRRVYVTEVVCDNISFLESKNASEGRGSVADNSYYPDESYDDTMPSQAYGISNDDLPF